MRKNLVLPSPHKPLIGPMGVSGMPTFKVRFNERSTMPDRIERRAAELGITPEQLIKRMISEGMMHYDCDDGPAIAGESLDDFLVKNGVLKPE